MSLTTPQTFGRGWFRASCAEPGALSTVFYGLTMTTQALAYGGSDLPPKIQRSIARALDPAFPIPMTAAERVALAALLRRVEARFGEAEFWVRRCNLAEVFGRVERTITNWLNALESKGLIEKEQGRSRWGNFSCVTVHLTKSAIELLGLNQSMAPLVRDSAPDRKKTSLGLNKSEFTEKYKEQSYQRHPGGDPLKNDCGERNHVPDDCKPLLELGLTPSAVFKLMGMASRRGKRLGPIVALKIDALKAARHAYGLLQSLAQDNVDYAALSKQMARKHAASRASEDAKKAIEQAKQRFREKWVKTSAGEALRINSSLLPERYLIVDGTWHYKGVIVGQEAFSFWRSAQFETWEIVDHPVRTQYPTSPDTDSSARADAELRRGPSASEAASFKSILQGLRARAGMFRRGG